VNDQQGPVPQGWYRDPRSEGHERFWDGAGWTKQVRAGSAEFSARLTGVDPESRPQPPVGAYIPSGGYRKGLSQYENRSLAAGAGGTLVGIAYIILGNSSSPVLLALSALGGASAVLWGGFAVRDARRSAISVAPAIGGLVLGLVSLALAGISLATAQDDVAASKYDEAYFEQQIESGIKEQIDETVDVTCPESVEDTSMNATFTCTAPIDEDFVVIDVQFTDKVGNFIWTPRN